ncbi:MAG TPA: sigma-70 family RNA polymerase sigma factor [Verrucomicrobiae bacterium]|nr:sigma-70 family RNA polymerase sigma factor [Verrucomicrobiae bacterium]
MAEREQLPVAQARSGDPEAWDVLYRRYQLPLYVYVYELVRDEQASLDLVQETFINAARYLSTLREDQRFGSWLFGIAHQKVIQRWRKSTREQLSFGELPEDALHEDPTPDELLIQQEDESRFMALLNELPPPHRSVLLLHYLEGFSLEQIAEVTGTSIGTVKSRLHYARKSLRKLLNSFEL